MPEIQPPPVHEEYEDTLVFNWFGYNVVKNRLVTHVTDVRVVNIEPDDPIASYPFLDTADRDEDVTGVALSVRVPDWSRFQEEQPEYEVDMFMDEYVRKEEFWFRHPVEVSNGWNSAWHPLAGLKSNVLYEGASVEKLEGCQVLVQHVGGDEWTLSIESPLSMLKGLVGMLESGNEELAYDL